MVLTFISHPGSIEEEFRIDEHFREKNKCVSKVASALTNEIESERLRLIAMVQEHNKMNKTASLLSPVSPVLQRCTYCNLTTW